METEEEHRRVGRERRQQGREGQGWRGGGGAREEY